MRYILAMTALMMLWTPAKADEADDIAATIVVDFPTVEEIATELRDYGRQAMQARGDQIRARIDEAISGTVVLGTDGNDTLTDGSPSAQ